ncbi:YciI family protein [Glycomyces albidus]|jgi:hypothetical protein|uniref:YCII-related domain-containing protein n=1 Tax=Glycomyces albidus TaxID=2656774 RepID=A0A6L5GCQ9_9ACTN|nr:YciI family protein [Glycomyces albidus]MQM27472.1 hypothetical protein [Glycomyces albidus]
MAKYLLLKHYRGGPNPHPNAVAGMDEWTPEEIAAHLAFMRGVMDDLRERGEFVEERALAYEGEFVRYGGEGRAPVTDGPFAETKDVIAGWMIIDVDSKARAYETAARLSAAPGKDGRPLHEWIEVRPFLSAPPVFE